MTWLKIDREEKLWRTYTADALGLLIKGLYNNDTAKDFPLFSEMIEGATVDNRSAAEIIQHILGEVQQIEGVKDEPS